MRYSLTILLMLYSLVCVCQQQVVKDFDTSKVIKPTENYIGLCCTPVETPAEVDLMKWRTYLIKNLELDSLATDTIPPGFYPVVVLFVIDRSGQIQDVRIRKDPGYGLGERVVKVISSFPDKWKPATRNGRVVKAYKQETITLSIGEECEEMIPSKLML
ncbi:MAG TPA: energy transducer TonB [Chitinophagaceae bacterium]